MEDKKIDIDYVDVDRNSSGDDTLLIMTFGITVIFAIFSGGFIDGILSKRMQKIIFANK